MLSCGNYDKRVVLFLSLSFIFTISSPVGWRLSSVAAQPHGALPERWSTCHIRRRWELLFVWHSLQCQPPCAWLSLTFGQIYNLTWVDRQMPITPSSLSLSNHKADHNWFYLCKMSSFCNLQSFSPFMPSGIIHQLANTDTSLFLFIRQLVDWWMQQQCLPSHIPPYQMNFLRCCWNSELKKSQLEEGQLSSSL